MFPEFSPHPPHSGSVAANPPYLRFGSRDSHSPKSECCFTTKFCWGSSRKYANGGLAQTCVVIFAFSVELNFPISRFVKQLFIARDFVERAVFYKTRFDAVREKSRVLGRNLVNGSRISIILLQLLTPLVLTTGLITADIETCFTSNVLEPLQVLGHNCHLPAGQWKQLSRPS